MLPATTVIFTLLASMAWRLRQVLFPTKSPREQCKWPTTVKFAAQVASHSWPSYRICEQLLFGSRSAAPSQVTRTVVVVVIVVVPVLVVVGLTIVVMVVVLELVVVLLLKVVVMVVVVIADIAVELVVLISAVA